MDSHLRGNDIFETVSQTTLLDFFSETF